VEEFLEGLMDPTGFGFLFLERLESHTLVSAMCRSHRVEHSHDRAAPRRGPGASARGLGHPRGTSQVSNFAKGKRGI